MVLRFLKLVISNTFFVRNLLALMVWRFLNRPDRKAIGTHFEMTNSSSLFSENQFYLCIIKSYTCKLGKI